MVINYRILITGSDGQLGRTFKRMHKGYPHFKLFFKNRSGVDITNYKEIKDFILTNKINCVINCAALTDVNNSINKKTEFLNVNAHAVEYLSKICCEYNAQLIHISTDYVFNGDKKDPYNENDKTDPINFYGYSKLCGEKKMLSYNLNRSIIIRTSWLFSEYENNFVYKIIDNLKRNKNKLNVTNLEFGSPTYCKDLVEVIFKILKKLDNNDTQIYHFANKGYCSRLDFAKKINSYLKSNVEICSSEKMVSEIKRPFFSALDSSKLINQFNLVNRSWEASLSELINNYYLKK